MKTNIYLDTTVISALFDARAPERQALTKLFWDRVAEYNVYISELVADEINGASQPLLDSMMNIVAGFTVLPVTQEARCLAGMYVKNGIFPEKYADDALHVALASSHQIGILLSWNFTHLVKIKTRRMVALVNAINGYNPLEIITPPEL